MKSNSTTYSIPNISQIKRFGIIRKSKGIWKAWDSLCVSKMDRGHGFRDIETFNLALLAKQWWRLIHNKDSFSFKVFKAHYFPTHDPSEVGVAQRSSFIWPSFITKERL